MDQNADMSYLARQVVGFLGDSDWIDLCLRGSVLLDDFEAHHNRHRARCGLPSFPGLPKHVYCCAFKEIGVSLREIHGECWVNGLVLKFQGPRR